ncbi:hypothetical protein GCM10011609_08300 [Lentzea pudingi]|uniref:Knr4/Smi1-like domain-containing protein n=1 Tax=Lentzea pudingi TaxID=1789439 RepID=A0ABQ2HD33_9PSEU|nr:SMI1/KNR4 family protein [Lentzea pudingi]GGM74748.1 hypothetical protein GCM10011609_08300 [Lentzea pudingi]
MIENPAGLLHGWLRAHAPKTFATINAEPDAQGIWKLAGLRYLAPMMWEPLTAEASAEMRAWLVKLCEESPHPEDPDGLAGTPSADFRRTFLPIASNGSGDFLYVDERPGPETGCVCLWWHDDHMWKKLWPSVDAMLTDVLRGLRTGEPVLADHVADMAGGEVVWRYAD